MPERRLAEVDVENGAWRVDADRCVIDLEAWYVDEAVLYRHAVEREEDRLADLVPTQPNHLSVGRGFSVALAASARVVPVPGSGIPAIRALLVAWHFELPTGGDLTARNETDGDALGAAESSQRDLHVEERRRHRDGLRARKHHWPRAHATGIVLVEGAVPSIAETLQRHEALSCGRRAPRHGHLYRRVEEWQVGERVAARELEQPHCLGVPHHVGSKRTLCQCVEEREQRSVRGVGMRRFER